MIFALPPLQRTPNPQIEGWLHTRSLQERVLQAYFRAASVKKRSGFMNESRTLTVAARFVVTLPIGPLENLTNRKPGLSDLIFDREQLRASS